MKRLLVVRALILVLGAACAPSGGQPKFNLTVLPSATSIPTMKDPRTAATLPQRIMSFDASPDSNLLAVATTKGAILYDMHSYQTIRTLNAGEYTSRVAWSPDGSKLAVGGSKDYGTPFFTGGDSSNSVKAHLTVYDTTTWKVIFEPQFGNEMVNQSFYDLAWSPDGRSIAFSTDLGGVQVIDAQTGKVISEQGGFAGTVTAIAWSPDGTRLIATNDMAYTMRRWKVSGGEYVRLFDPRSSAYRTVEWSPDGTRIASGDGRGGVCFWTAATNECDGFVHAHRTATFSLTWSADGHQLATGGGVIRIWDTHTGQLLKAFGEDSKFIYERLQWLPKDGRLASLQTSIDGSGATMVRLWDISSGSAIVEFRGVQPGE